LSDKVRQLRTSQVDTVKAAAIAKCGAGDYQAGIRFEDHDHQQLARRPAPLARPVIVRWVAFDGWQAATPHPLKK
jgi:hypothetical protein